MREFDRINNFLPDELMVEIFRYLDLNENREAASLVCKRWLGLVRLSRETIRIGFSASTDDLVELLTDRFVNVRDVSIDEFPLSSLARKFVRIRMCSDLLCFILFGFDVGF
ncbi:F-box/LRR-repeat protein 4 [Abeliophyllum distichum]|uniref:F-box/LRR-repeat protein 4 n=1 Tax=Abeliophyllum distichum TaxID=126358 RepID=A0ABD1T083_9LAMI